MALLNDASALCDWLGLSISTQWMVDPVLSIQDGRTPYLVGWKDDYQACSTSAASICGLSTMFL